jgi:hypothetical protein
MPWQEKQGWKGVLFGVHYKGVLHATSRTSLLHYCNPRYFCAFGHSCTNDILGYCCTTVTSTRIAALQCVSTMVPPVLLLWKTRQTDRRGPNVFFAQDRVRKTPKGCNRWIQTTYKCANKGQGLWLNGRFLWKENICFCTLKRKCQ